MYSHPSMMLNTGLYAGLLFTSFSVNRLWRASCSIAPTWQPWSRSSTPPRKTSSSTCSASSAKWVYFSLVLHVGNVQGSKFCAFPVRLATIRRFCPTTAKHVGILSPTGGWRECRRSKLSPGLRWRSTSTISTAVSLRILSGVKQAGYTLTWTNRMEVKLNVCVCFRFYTPDYVSVLLEKMEDPNLSCTDKE